MLELGRACHTRADVVGQVSEVGFELRLIFFYLLDYFLVHIRNGVGNGCSGFAGFGVRLIGQRTAWQHFRELRGVVCPRREDLRVKNMVQNHSLAKSISDAAWAQFIAILTFKAAEAGRVTVAVNPRNTSQTCVCGKPVPKDLSERWHLCPRCGLSLPRDQVSAMRIKALGLELLVQQRGLGSSPQAPTWPAGACVA